MGASPGCGWALELDNLAFHGAEVELSCQFGQGAAFLSHGGHIVLLEEGHCLGPGLAVTVLQVFQDLFDDLLVHLTQKVLKVCHGYMGGGLCPIGLCR